MDPLTQASLGAAAAAAVCRRPEMRRAVLLGAFAGAAPDLDVLIRSDADPLLALEYHRHFSHALLLAPVVGLVVAALFKGLFFWKPWPFGRLALFGIAGAITHGLLDTCTSYGTLLYWPLNEHRESWDIISIIDPLFTLPLLLMLGIAAGLRRPRFAQIGLASCLFYLGLGVYQRGEATEWTRQLAASRGHQAEVLTVRPSFANIVLWRSVYRVEGQYFIDAVRVFPGRPPVHYPGEIVTAYSSEDARRNLPPGSVLAGDVARFRLFSQGYLHRHPEYPDVIGDTRYAMHPDSSVPLWGIRVDTQEPEFHVTFEHFRDPSPEAFSRLWRMIRGTTDL